MTQASQLCSGHVTVVTEVIMSYEVDNWHFSNAMYHN